MVGLEKIINWLVQLDDWLYYRNRKSKDEIIRLIINKQLKPYKVDYDYVIKNPQINGEDWFRYYRFNNEKEFEKWKRYSIKLLKRHVTQGSEEIANREFSMIDLYCGLMHNY